MYIYTYSTCPASNVSMSNKLLRQPLFGQQTSRKLYLFPFGTRTDLALDVHRSTTEGFSLAAPMRLTQEWSSGSICYEFWCRYIAPNSIELMRLLLENNFHQFWGDGMILAHSACEFFKSMSHHVSTASGNSN